MTGHPNYGKLKPILPLTYDGSADSCALHRFVTEGTAFVEAGGVKAKEQVFILSHYLGGKAHEFYVREVAGNPFKWRPCDFFLELFNSCLPIDFRMKQREKLKWTYQNERSVRDYVSELNELWNLIGDISECDQVMKLWFGFQPYIQSNLWKDKLNPEKSPLKAVIAAAEVIEIAHSVTTRQERPPKGHISSKPGPKGNDLSNKAEPVTSSPQLRNNEAQGSLSRSDRAHDNPPRPTNERRDQARSSCNNQGQPTRPGTRVTDKTRLSKEEHD